MERPKQTFWPTQEKQFITGWPHFPLRIWTKKKRYTIVKVWWILRSNCQTAKGHNQKTWQAKDVHQEIQEDRFKQKPREQRQERKLTFLLISNFPFPLKPGENSFLAPGYQKDCLIFLEGNLTFYFCWFKLTPVPFKGKSFNFLHSVYPLAHYGSFIYVTSELVEFYYIQCWT